MKVYFAILLIILSSCTPAGTPPKAPLVHEDTYRPEAGGLMDGVIQIITIDSCEYLFYYRDGGYDGGPALCHKGNCSNVVHNLK